MANDFYFNPIERVAGIADSCGMQIMSSTRRPYDTRSLTHLLEASTDLRTIQLLMGHERLEDTTVYLQLSRRHLHAAINLLEQIALRTKQQDRKR